MNHCRSFIALAMLVLLAGLVPAHADPADPAKTRGISIPAAGIGGDYPVAALLGLVRTAKVGQVIIDWDCIPETWPKTNGPAVAQLVNTLALGDVKVAAMYRPRFLKSPTVPTQVKANGFPADLKGFEICYSDEKSRQWGAAWGPAILALSPAWEEVIISQPEDRCHCRLCADRTLPPTALPTPSIVQFLGEARQALKRYRPEAKLGLAGGLSTPYWQPVLQQIDVAHPLMNMNEQIAYTRALSPMVGLRPLIGDKLGSCLARITSEYDVTCSADYLAKFDRQAAAQGVPYVLWSFETSFLSADYDPQEVCEALGIDWAAIYPCLDQMVIESQTNLAPPLVRVDEARLDRESVKGRYAVVTGLQPDDPYYQAAEALAEHRGVEVTYIPFTPYQAFYLALQQLGAEQVAVVARPSDVGPDFAGTLFMAAANMDHDPELDFTYGIITGATAQDAVDMVTRTVMAERNNPAPRRAVCVGHVFDGMAHCFTAMENRANDYKRMGMQTDTVRFDDADKDWAQHKDAEMAKFEGATVVVFCGHGSGSWSAGIKGSDLFNVTLNGAISFDGTCYANAVSELWMEVNKTRQLQLVKLAPPNSVTLGLIHAGAIGRVGSVCSSGFMLVSDAMKAVDQGLSMGEAFRRGQDASIKRAKLRSVSVCAYREGQLSPQKCGSRTQRLSHCIAPVVLYGDPAYVPYPGGLPNAAAVNAKAPAGTPTQGLPQELKLVAGRNEYVMRGGNGVATMVIQYLAERFFTGAPYAAVSDNRGVRALLRFDLSRVSLPAGMAVKKATLRVYAEKPVATGEPGERLLGLHEVTQGWEPEVTWATMPKFAEAPLVTVPFERAVKWLEFDVTKQVNAWLKAPADNHGLMFKFVTEGQQPFVSWNLANGMATDESTRPRLMIECQ
ncbi:MAG: DNRLRE domain-containing protein [Armatimonadia bacterium]